MSDDNSEHDDNGQATDRKDKGGITKRDLWVAPVVMSLNVPHKAFAAMSPVGTPAPVTPSPAAPTEAPLNPPTQSPTGSPVEAPTPSPTPRPTPSPTPSLTPSPTPAPFLEG